MSSKPKITTTMSNANELMNIVRQFEQSRVLCVGDLIVDTFNHGSVDRISPERPVPVFRPGDVIHLPGGAANVAANVSALGAHCSLVGIIGCDHASTILRRLLGKYLNLTPFLIQSSRYTTTHKIRFTSGSQHLLRVDNESNALIEESALSEALSTIDALIKDHDVLILSDYSKGFLSPSFLSSAIASARQHNTPVIVDPKGKDFERYAGATLLTPNTAEAELVSGTKIETDRDAEVAGQTLLASRFFESILITRGAKGMSLLSSTNPPVHLANGACEVFDVVGAGDTVVATMACSIGSHATMTQAAACANFAAGIVVGKRDTATVFPHELLMRISEISLGHHDKEKPSILSRNNLIHLVLELRQKGSRIGFTNGVFDIVHSGHISLLNFASDNCDVLVVGINSDASVRRLGKGQGRPVNHENDRATVLGALGMVHVTTIFDEDTPLELINIIRPDVLIKGSDYTIETVVGSGLVLSYGGKVLLAPIQEGKSTTGLIQDILLAGNT